MHRRSPMPLLAILLSGCAASAADDDTQATVAAVMAQSVDHSQLDIGPPYLSGPIAGTLAMVPPPPADGSPEAQLDAEANAAALAMSGSPRWALANADAQLGTDRIQRAFSCAAGMLISDATTPRIADLVRRAAADYALTPSAVKAYYDRQRPFAANEAPTCTPEAEPFLARNGSYPSGHAVIGNGTGLILARVFPERRDALLARGRAFADSRRVCNVHWHSDVEAGMAMGAAMFARLLDDDAFKRDLAAAREEADALAADPPLPAPAACDAEARALAR